MKKMYPIYLLLCASSLIAFAACNKEEDVEVNAKKKKDTSSECQVLSMYYAYSSDSIGVTVSYNKWGSPVRVTQTLTGTGHPDGIFWYNNKKQLTDYIGAYNDNSFEFWHRYVYDNKGRVIRDTTYFFGYIVNGEPDTYYDLAVITYEYDQEERIVHTAQAWFNDPANPLHTYYSYDGSGNLVVPGVVYDDKSSIHRTNPVWMFIDRNYSQNNGYATTWNADGLPTHMNLSDKGGRFAGFYYGRLSNIQYQCDGKSGKGKGNGNGNNSPF
ncbi:MAG: hypothetical protein J7621_11350 [Niastella sp.]|nr:hypothetical protein [Niastella sp.]